jgi:integral membrane protein (TIGR01906 family)
MDNVKRFTVALLHTKALFLIPLSILILLHSVLYPLWLNHTNYSSSFFEHNELISSQRILAKALYAKPLDSLVLSEREQVHINDVVNLVHGVFVYTIFLVSILLLIGLKKWHRGNVCLREFRKNISIMYVVTLLFLILAFTLQFDRTFLLFHRLVFRNDFWQLNVYDLLINVYPPEFFKVMLMSLLTLSLFFYIVTIAISYTLYNKYDKT